MAFFASPILTKTLGLRLLDIGEDVIVEIHA